LQKLVDFYRFVFLQMKWIKLKHQQCNNFFYNNKTKHNSVQTFCRTPVEHLREPKKDNKKLSQPQNQAQFGSDILSNTCRASLRTKKRQQKIITTTKPSIIRFRHFVEHPASIFKNKKRQQKFIKTKPSSDRPLRERKKKQKTNPQ
jgi:hypothetical protein